MLRVKNYQRPAIAVSEFAIERGFCVTIEFGAGVESPSGPGSFGLDDMTESTDNAAW